MRSNLAAHLLRYPDRNNSLISQIIPDTLETEWALSVNLHHDTITGTSRNLVHEHYLARSNIIHRTTRFTWMNFIEAKLNIEMPQSSSAEDELPLEQFEKYNFMYYKEEITPAFEAQERATIRARGWDFRYTSYNETPYLDFSVSNRSVTLVMNSANPGPSILILHSRSACVKVDSCDREFSSQSCVADGSLKRLLSYQTHNTSIYEHQYEVNLLPYESVLVQFTNDTACEESEWLKWPGLVEQKNISNITNTTNATTNGSNTSGTPTKDPAIWLKGNCPIDDSAVVGGHPQLKVHFVQNSDMVVEGLLPGVNLTVGLYEYQYGRVTQGPKDYQGSYRYPGKYIFTTSTMEPIRRSVTSCYKQSGPGFALYTLNLTAVDECQVQLRFMPSAPAHERFVVKFLCPDLKESQVPRDMIVRYNTHQQDGGVFYTDSNSYYSTKRARGVNGLAPESNYYPITRFGRIEGKNSTLTVLVDRAEGATSPEQGVLEIMYNRISPNIDDNLGAVEGNIHSGACNVEHKVILEVATTSEALASVAFRQAQSQIESPVTVAQIMPKIIGIKFSLKKAPIPHTAERGLSAWAADKNGKACDNQLVKAVVDTREGTEVYLRVTWMHDTQDGFLDVLAIARETIGLQNINIVKEVPIDFNGEIEDVLSTKDRWDRYRSPTDQSKDQPAQGRYFFPPLKIRAFEISYDTR